MECALLVLVLVLGRMGGGEMGVLDEGEGKGELRVEGPLPRPTACLMSSTMVMACGCEGRSGMRGLAGVAGVAGGCMAGGQMVQCSAQLQWLAIALIGRLVCRGCRC